MDKDFNLDNCFLGTIWPTNESNIEEIVKIIKNNYKIHKLFRFEFDASWSEIIRIIYKDDRVKEKNLINKISVMSKYPKFLYLCYIDVPNPAYRFKKDGRKMSTSMEKLKKNLRSIFGGKSSPNNPIHIVDEQEHTLHLHDNIKKDGRFTEYDRFK